MIMTNIDRPSWTRTVDFTPGLYLKVRRRTTRLEIADVAARIGTIPHVPEHDRVAWLERIEADLVPVSPNTIDQLARVFRLDLHVLAALAAIARGERDPALAPRICRICACSWRLPCVRGHEACAWVEGQDLCTACDHPLHGAAA